MQPNWEPQVLGLLKAAMEVSLGCSQFKALLEEVLLLSPSCDGWQVWSTGCLQTTLLSSPLVLPPTVNCNMAAGFPQSEGTRSVSSGSHFLSQPNLKSGNPVLFLYICLFFCILLIESEILGVPAHTQGNECQKVEIYGPSQRLPITETAYQSFYVALYRVLNLRDNKRRKKKEKQPHIKLNSVISLFIKGIVRASVPSGSDG